VELNAMTSDQFVDWLELRLTEHGVQKVVPASDILGKAYQQAVRTIAYNAELNRLEASLQHQPIDIPDALAAHVRDVLLRYPELSWDAAVLRIARTAASSTSATEEDFES
jgi:hypothetical protein